jgi:AraC-like DNA-binding protein
MSTKNCFKKLPHNQFDGMEILKATEYNKSFPLHSHETFCISLIENGTFKENQQYGVTGDIFITNPNEIHDNEMVFDTGYSFTTLYVSPDILTSLNHNQPFLFNENVIKNPSLFQQIEKIAATTLNSDPLSIYNENQLLLTLKNLIQQDINTQNTPFFDKSIKALEDVKSYITHNISNKLTLDDLAKMLDLDRFKFVRLFKKQVGITPFGYITMLRIERSKAFLQQGTKLTDAALDAGFYDQSHFTNYFKHYVGVTPKAYQEGCNILQDIGF